MATNTQADKKATEQTKLNECKNGQEGCCGPNGDDLPCFECYMERD